MLVDQNEVIDFMQRVLETNLSLPVVGVVQHLEAARKKMLIEFKALSITAHAVTVLLQK